MAKYSAGFTTLDANSAIDLQDMFKIDDVEMQINETGIKTFQSNEDGNATKVDARLINLFYSSTDVKVSTTSLKVDFNTFVSNVGGSLGLFIGFSVLGGIFFLYDIIFSKFISKD